MKLIENFGFMLKLNSMYLLFLYTGNAETILFATDQ